MDNTKDLNRWDRQAFYMGDLIQCVSTAAIHEYHEILRIDPINIDYFNSNIGSYKLWRRAEENEALEHAAFNPNYPHILEQIQKLIKYENETRNF